MSPRPQVPPKPCFFSLSPGSGSQGLASRMALPTRSPNPLPGHLSATSSPGSICLYPCWQKWLKGLQKVHIEHDARGGGGGRPNTHHAGTQPSQFPGPSRCRRTSPGPVGSTQPTPALLLPKDQKKKKAPIASSNPAPTIQHPSGYRDTLGTQVHGKAPPPPNPISGFSVRPLGLL